MPEPENASTATDSTPATPNSAPAPRDSAPAADSSPLAFPPKPEDSRLVVLREVTTTVIAMVILGVSVFMMLKTFASAGGNFDQMKDIMLYALPILGTVMGYYFGRVPAERRAEASEKKAGEAQATAQNATVEALQTRQEKEQKLQEVKLGLERISARAEGGQGDGSEEGGQSDLLGASHGGTSGGGSSGKNAALLSEIDALRRIL